MPIDLRGIDHVEVFVRDLDAAAAWYGRILGLEQVHRWEPEPLFVGRGSSRLALFRADDTPRDEPSRTPHWHRVAWLTDAAGFAAAARHLSGEGVSFRGPVDHGLARSIYFEDPDGNPLEITYYV